MKTPIERGYQQKFNRSLDYKSLGVKNIEELLVKLDHKKMVLLIKEPEMEEKYVMSARSVEIKKDFLKLNVQKLLDENRGEIILQRYSGGGSSKLRREGDKGRGQDLQFKKKEDMDEKIEGCRTYEEDDDILLSLWLTEFLLVECV
ncbi:hypothetical protein Tco_1138281 [Tanacetum coccineum]